VIRPREPLPVIPIMCAAVLCAALAVAASVGFFLALAWALRTLWPG